MQIYSSIPIGPIARSSSPLSAPSRSRGPPAPNAARVPLGSLKQTEAACSLQKFKRLRHTPRGVAP